MVKTRGMANRTEIKEKKNLNFSNLTEPVFNQFGYGLGHLCWSSKFDN